jgi:hypothetical protein
MHLHFMQNTNGSEEGTRVGRLDARIRPPSNGVIRRDRYRSLRVFDCESTAGLLGLCMDPLFRSVSRMRPIVVASESWSGVLSQLKTTIARSSCERWIAAERARERNTVNLVSCRVVPADVALSDPRNGRNR